MPVRCSLHKLVISAASSVSQLCQAVHLLNLLSLANIELSDAQ